MGNNDLRTEDSVITKWGYLVAIASTVFGLCCFLIGRKIYEKMKKSPREIYRGKVIQQQRPHCVRRMMRRNA